MKAQKKLNNSGSESPFFNTIESNALISTVTDYRLHTVQDEFDFNNVKNGILVQNCCLYFSCVSSCAFDNGKTHASFLVFKAKNLKYLAGLFIKVLEQKSENWKFCFFHHTILWVLTLCRM